MFNNPGNKLKILALVIFWLIFGSGILGVLIAIVVTRVASHGEAAVYAIPFALFALLGSFVSAWLSSIFLYAFGQQVEDTAAIKERLDYIVCNLPPREQEQPILMDPSPYSAKANPRAYDQNPYNQNQSNNNPY